MIEIFSKIKKKLSKLRLKMDVHSKKTIQEMLQYKERDQRKSYNTKPGNVEKKHISENFLIKMDIRDIN